MAVGNVQGNKSINQTILIVHTHINRTILTLMTRVNIVKPVMESILVFNQEKIKSSSQKLKKRRSE